MKINILDAGLRDKGGHNFDFDRNVVRHLVNTGHDVRIYTYAGVSDEAKDPLAEFAPVEPILRPFFYAPAHQVDFFAGELTRFLRHAEAMAEDLKKVRDADLWFWPTMAPQDLLASAWVKPSATVVGCIHVDPGIARKTIGAHIWRYAFLEAQRHELRFTPGSIEPEIRSRFMEIVAEGGFAVFPHPFDGEPIAEPKTSLKRIGIFGHQRPDKGMSVMPDLIGHLLRADYQVLFQDSWGHEHSFNHPNLEVLGYVDDLNEPLKSCDLVVLPYNIEPYQSHGSGILAHCFRLGIPVIGPLATIPGRLIEQFDVGPMFQQNRASALIAAVRMAQANYEHYAQNAFKLSRWYSKVHGSAQFAEAALKLVK